MRTLPTALFAAFLSACATTPGGKPHDQSAVGHEQAAVASEREASGHEQQFNPSAEQTRERCTGIGGARRWRDGLDSPCWTSTVNPTQAHLTHAKKHRKAAADHRAASKALRDAEAQACTGIPEDERDVSPFFLREDILDVKVERGLPSAKQQLRQPIGVIVTFRAVPGLTSEWLQRSVDCHIARNAALGHDLDEVEMNYCPLVPRDVKARVTSTGSGFVVMVTSDNPKSVNEIIRRAQMITGTPERSP